MSIQSIGNQAFSMPTEPQVTSRQSESVASLSEEKSSQSALSTSSPKQVEDAVKSMNDFVGSINSSLNFSVDNDTGKTIVKVMDLETKKVLKQIPSEDMVAMAKAVDKLKGLLVNQKA